MNVLTLQSLLLAADSKANDLPDGESGITGRNVKRKARQPGGGGSRKRKQRGHRAFCGYEWAEEEEDDFEVEAIVGKVVADGKTHYSNLVSCPSLPEPVPSPSAHSLSHAHAML